MKTKTITSAGTADEYESRATVRKRAVREGVARGGAIAPSRVHSRARRGELQKGDLLAIPLCILWGMSLWLASYGPAGFILGGDGWSADLSLLWSWPATVVRFLFGW